MAFKGDEEQLSAKKDELASLDGRHKTIMERLKSKKSSSDLILNVSTMYKLKNYLTCGVGNRIRAMINAHANPLDV
jgi:hypothetical protein